MLKANPERKIVVSYFCSFWARIAPKTESMIPIIATALYRAYSGGISICRNVPIIKPKISPNIIRIIFPPLFADKF